MTVLPFTNNRGCQKIKYRIEILKIFSKGKAGTSLTSTSTVLLITAIQTVGVGVTPPTDGDAVSIVALKVVGVAFQITAMLKSSQVQE